MADLNSVTITGNLVSDPTYRQTDSGIAVANFTLAVNPFQPEGQAERPATFIKCVCWRGRADQIAEQGDLYIRGKKMLVVGRLENTNSTFTNDSGTEVRNRELQLVVSYFGPEAVSIDPEVEAVHDEHDSADTSGFDEADLAEARV